MQRLLTACLLSLSLSLCLSLAGPAHAATDASLTREVNAFVDGWHDDAANTRMAYFDKIAKDGVYIGTDHTELWTRDEFKAWSKKYFDAKAAWTFKATRRNVYASADKSLIWFDELLDTKNMGPAMASGVLRKTKTGFEIVHYQLSLAVPNAVNEQVVGIIAAHEQQPKK
ncbi:hypothetical protein RCH14_001186 [Massilia sp. MP_M2]|uniref:nuclear transport factor 2 family protein n=1 Tax=Massilia sp. MP_M2 TaxID=3071713 RepID=UPI00319E0CEA